MCDRKNNPLSPLRLYEGIKASTTVTVFMHRIERLKADHWQMYVVMVVYLVFLLL